MIIVKAINAPINVFLLLMGMALIPLAITTKVTSFCTTDVMMPVKLHA